MNLKKRIPLITIIILLALHLSIVPPAHASLREYHDTSGITLYSSKHSLIDREGYSWQIILFPVLVEGKTAYNLRLVGFPGVTEFNHPQPLEIITSNGEVLLAEDLFFDQSPAPNVGQYDLTNIVDHLPKNGLLKMILPLKNNQEKALKITTSIVLEWQWLVKEI